MLVKRPLPITTTHHPGKDFLPIQNGDPIFLHFDGTVETLQIDLPSALAKDEIMYPFFVNEAAYYEKGIAFMIAKKSIHNFDIEL